MQLAVLMYASVHGLIDLVDLLLTVLSRTWPFGSETMS